MLMNWPCLNILDKTELLMLHAKTRAKSGSVLALRSLFFANLYLTQHISEKIFLFQLQFSNKNHFPEKCLTASTH